MRLKTSLEYAPEKKGKAPYSAMFNKELIDKIRRLKVDQGYTLYELSKRVDVQPSTLERWLKTNRINRLYAEMVTKKLGI